MIDADVIVVGSGNAALCAAIAALEHGASVLIVEKAPKHLAGGNIAVVPQHTQCQILGMAQSRYPVRQFPDMAAQCGCNLWNGRGTAFNDVPQRSRV